ncbi:MAG: hypothetical protein BWY82_01217 [Verrucomicrobia bacterium ADurb.Bin474]|nr:MAG: hypothetical protein BWY82_01217 [Verrucomicrobia bacterium ADurb.Bin474]
MRDGIRRCRPVFVAGGELALCPESKCDLMQTEPVRSAHGAFTSVRGNVLRIRSGDLVCCFRTLRKQIQA